MVTACIKTINTDGVTWKLVKKQNLNLPWISDHPYRAPTISGLLRWKIALLNLVSHQPDIDNIYLYTKDPNEAKYKLRI